MMSSPINFTGVAISLEKQDYYHLKSLPMDFKKYIKTKFIVSTFLQISLGIIMFMIMLILAGISIELFIITTLEVFLSYLLEKKFPITNKKTIMEVWKNPRKYILTVIIFFVAFVFEYI